MCILCRISNVVFFFHLCISREAIQSLQAEVSTLKERLESCLSNKPLRPVRAAPPAQVADTHCYTSTPRIRLAE